MASTVVISTFYLVPQMLGAGLLFEMLLHWNFVWVTVGLGILMSIYIIFGGMKATLYNQVIQAAFLWGTMVVLVTLAFFMIGNGSFFDIIATAKQTVPPLIAAKDPAVVMDIKDLPADQAIVTAHQMLPEAHSAMTICTRSISTPTLQKSRN